MYDDAATAQVKAILTRLANLKPEDFGLRRYRPNFVLVNPPKPKTDDGGPVFRTFYCAGIGVGASITFLSAWVSLSLYLVNPM